MGVENLFCIVKITSAFWVSTESPTRRIQAAKWNSIQSDMRLKTNAYSEKSVAIGFIFTFVALFGLANIILSGVKGQHWINAYILRLFSYRWKFSGATG